MPLKPLPSRLGLPLALFNLFGVLVGGVIGIMIGGHSFAPFFVGAFVGIRPARKKARVGNPPNCFRNRQE